MDLKSTIEKFSLKITGVISIGGHYGEEYPIYKSLGIKDITFFEPVKSSFDILKNSVGSECNLINKALGNQTGKITMNIEKENQGFSSSILKPKLHLQQYTWIKFGYSEEVEIDKLDNFQFPIDYNMIVIDVQGYELEVFRGAIETLKNIDYIYSEVNLEELYEGCVLLTQLDDFLGKYNFQRMEIVLEHPLWGNALYIKNKKY